MKTYFYYAESKDSGFRSYKRGTFESNKKSIGLLLELEKSLKKETGIDFVVVNLSKIDD